MPNTQTIQFLRKNSEPTNIDLTGLLKAQPLYDLQNHKLYMGNGNGATLINPSISIKVNANDPNPVSGAAVYRYVQDTIANLQPTATTERNDYY